MTNSTKPDRRFAVSQKEEEKKRRRNEREENRTVNRFAFYR